MVYQLGNIADAENVHKGNIPLRVFQIKKMLNRAILNKNPEECCTAVNFLNHEDTNIELKRGDNYTAFRTYFSNLQVVVPAGAQFVSQTRLSSASCLHFQIPIIKSGKFKRAIPNSPFSTSLTTFFSYYLRKYSCGNLFSTHPILSIQQMRKCTLNLTRVSPCAPLPAMHYILSPVMKVSTTVSGLSSQRTQKSVNYMPTKKSSSNSENISKRNSRKTSTAWPHASLSRKRIRNRSGVKCVLSSNSKKRETILSDPAFHKQSKIKNKKVSSCMQSKYHICKSRMTKDTSKYINVRKPPTLGRMPKSLVSKGERLYDKTKPRRTALRMGSKRIALGKSITDFSWPKSLGDRDCMSAKHRKFQRKVVRKELANGNPVMTSHSFLKIRKGCRAKNTEHTLTRRVSFSRLETALPGALPIPNTVDRTKTTKKTVSDAVQLIAAYPHSIPHSVLTRMPLQDLASGTSVYPFTSLKKFFKPFIRNQPDTEDHLQKQILTNKFPKLVHLVCLSERVCKTNQKKPISPYYAVDSTVASVLAALKLKGLSPEIFEMDRIPLVLLVIRDSSLNQQSCEEQRKAIMEEIQKREGFEHIHVFVFPRDP